MPKSTSRSKASAKGSSSSQPCFLHETRCGSAGQGCMVTDQQAYDYFRSRKEWKGTPEAEPDPSSPEHERWRDLYIEFWRNLTCPCGRGYYCRPHGKWISGKNLPDRTCRYLDQLGITSECLVDSSYHGGTDADLEESTAYGGSLDYEHTTEYQDYEGYGNEPHYEPNLVNGFRTPVASSNTIYDTDNSWDYKGKHVGDEEPYMNGLETTALPVRLAANQATVEESDSVFLDVDEDLHFPGQAWESGRSGEPSKKGHSHHKRRSKK